jgi:hypothetical protein
MVVASRLGPDHYLIGPALYPIYRFVLKMVLLWILLPIFLFIVGPVNLANSNGQLGSAIATTIGDLCAGASLLLLSSPWSSPSQSVPRRMRS